MHQIEACKQQISDYEGVETNYKSSEHILMLNNAVQSKPLWNFAWILTSSDQRMIIKGTLARDFRDFPAYFEYINI